MPYGSTEPSDARHVVTAVLVTHDGSRWLPETLAALASQDRPVQRLVVADTGSRDGTSEVLGERVGEECVLHLPRTTGFGAAVAKAVATVEPALASASLVPAGAPSPGGPAGGGGETPVEWLWLLHDDSAPAPDALAHLLAVAETSPSAAVLGPKLRSWYDPDRLLEVGVTVTGSGRRETGLERGETDQGQHDGIREVLAVSTAGMLIRRDVFERLGGFDPAFPIFRDDLDLCWRVNLADRRVLVVPDAVVHHAEAASQARRRIDCARDHRHLVDRRHALQVLLANLPLAALPLSYARLVAVSLLRCLGYVLSKRLGYAVDELAALLLVLVRPDKVVSSRRRRRRSGPLHHRAARHLLAPPGAQVKHVLEVVTGVVTGRQDALDRPAMRGETTAESGPVSDDVENLVPPGGDGLRRVLGRPSLLILGGLLLVTLAAARDLLWGGTLMGGALLPSPSGAGALWHTYLSSWHPVGTGSDATAPPYIAVLAVLGTLLLGKAGLVVDLVFLLAVPLAGVVAYRASAGLVDSRVLRAWAAVAYALLPAVTGAIAAGRLGTVVGVLLLPPLARLVLRTAGLLDRPPAPHTPWAAGAVLAVVTAFVTPAYLLTLVLSGVALAVVRRRDLALRLGIVLVVPPVVLVPWTLDVLRDPSLLLLEAGALSPGLSDPSLSPLAVVLLHPGGPGMYRLLLTAGLVLAALAALLRPARRGLLVGSWAVALTSLCFALVMSRFDVSGPTAGVAAAAWPGFPLAVAGLALLVAAAVGAEGALEGLVHQRFSWRQPVVLALAVVAGLTPVLAAFAWVVHGAGHPLQRRDPEVLPAYVAAEASTARQTRTLVLREDDTGRVRYAVLRDTAPRLGLAESAPRADTQTRLDSLVADIMSARGGGDEADRLAGFGVRYVLVTGTVEPAVIDRLDAVPGIDRVSTERRSALWQLRGSPARLMLRAPDGQSATPVPSRRVNAQATLPPGEPGRLLVLAEQADDGWRATIDGREVRPVTVDGWAQGFEVPESGGRLALTHSGGGAVRWSLVQAVLAFAALVMALPGARTEDEPAVRPAAPAPGSPSRSGAGSRRASGSGRRGRRRAAQAGGHSGSGRAASGRAGRSRSGRSRSRRSRRRT